MLEDSSNVINVAFHSLTAVAERSSAVAFKVVSVEHMCFVEESAAESLADRLVKSSMWVARLVRQDARVVCLSTNFASGYETGSGRLALQYDLRDSQDSSIRFKGRWTSAHEHARISGCCFAEIS